MIWLLLIGLALATAPFIWEALRKPMDSATRAAAPGRYAELSRGTTYYQWHGPDDGPVVVCVHGLTTPSYVWDGIAPALAEDGFRVLTFDLYGRGFSDRPPGAQDSAFFNHQIADLLADQNITDRISLVGHSMGGAIVTAFAASALHPVDRVVLVAPAGMQAVGEGTLQRMVHVPLLSRWLMLGVYPLMLAKHLRPEADQHSYIPGINARQRAEMQYKGYFPAVHSSVVHMLTEPFQSFHESLGARDLPVLAIWGADDTVIPLAVKDRLSNWNPNVAHEVVPNAGHGLTYSHAPEVLEHMIPFLKAGD